MSSQPSVKVQTQQSGDEQVSVGPSTPHWAPSHVRTQKDIDVVKEYMRIAYSPSENKGRASVEHLVASDATFTAPTTFPECHTPLDYADSHATVMSALDDLHIISFDLVHAKGGLVALRYTAEGTHKGKSHNGIEPTGKHARWTAAALFEVKNGKITSFTKEWDKLNMWKQLGWMKGDEYV
jgi:predicted ester cyclase